MPAPEQKPKSPAQQALAKLGLVRDIDLCLHLPIRYEDETHITRLRDARHGETVQIEAVVITCEIQIRGKRQLVVQVDDGSDSCILRFFNVYPSMQKTLAVGQRLRFRGEVQRSLIAGYAMLHPTFKSAAADLPDALSPVYPTVAQLPQAYLRKAVHGALDRAVQRHTLQETLFHAALQGIHAPMRQSVLPTLSQALQLLHRPAPDVAVSTLEDFTHPAWQRLIAEELLAQQLSQQAARAVRAKQVANALIGAGDLVPALKSVIGFALTGAQERATKEVFQDLALSQPMHRLLQGDVGSGKTVVAALAAARCIEAGKQCALMVPTEILATQHFAKLVGWLQPLLAARGQTVAWLSGSLKAKERRAMLADIAEGRAMLIVGTHAIIQSQVAFHNLALVVIDEQHRFGVAQRLALREKTPEGVSAHLLMMSATPIPRTLAMSYLADLDVSTLDELPPGRTPVLTKLLNVSRREQVVSRIEEQIAAGRQVYWVCPMIEESETLDLANATQTHADLCVALPARRVALLHAKLSVDEKRSIMAAFTAGELDVLVSTTVIEVGVDVPNATLMVIEHAERFGLAQLHQLRGRVGRGANASVCILLYDTGEAARLGDAAKARLKAMVETTDGFEIAKRDLQIRGPGDFLGARQSGLQVLRFANPTERVLDAAWLDWARAAAPLMLQAAPDVASTHMQRWLPHGVDFLGA